MTTANVENLQKDETFSRSQIVRRRFLRNKLAIFGLFGIGFMFILAFLGPFLSPYSYDYLDFNNMLTPPCRVPRACRPGR